MLCMLYIFFLLIIKVHCDNNISYPKFPKQAEFFIESLVNFGQYQRIIYQCIYDYNKNQLIIINEQIYEYYNYTTLKIAIYSLKQCNIDNSIERDNPLDGFSAITNINDKTTHIRLLDDFFLLTSNANYLGENILRGFIHVYQWNVSISNDSDIIWSFAKPNYTMSSNINDNYSIPIQRIIQRKDNGLILQILNIFNYKTIISKKNLIPPKGIFCQNLISNNELISLQDIGMAFSKNKFSVKIDISTSLQYEFYQSVHLRYYKQNKQKLIRFDYTYENNILNSISIIFDISQNISHTYKINRRTGSCIINQSNEISFLTSILHNPIEALIKYKDFLLFNPPKQFFQYTGQRLCRGSILCEIYIGQITDLEQDWLIINIEWGWFKQDQYNYPIYLDLNLYKSMNELPENIHYEFYDYHFNVYLNEFDINLCYRSNQLEYQHLAFQLKIINQTILNNNIENHFINRRQLIESIRLRMINIMSIEYLRLSQLELDYYSNAIDHNDTFYCIFTLLDQIPFVNKNFQIGLFDAQEKLKNEINTGAFQIHIFDEIFIEGIPNSLENIQYFYVFNSFPNTTIRINRTVQEKIEIIQENIFYTIKIQIIAILSGIFIGILSGSFIVFIVTYIMKKKANISSKNILAFQNISFYKQEEQATINMEHPIHNIINTIS